MCYTHCVLRPCAAAGLSFAGGGDPVDPSRTLVLAVHDAGGMESPDFQVGQEVAGFAGGCVGAQVGVTTGEDLKTCHCINPCVADRQEAAAAASWLPPAAIPLTPSFLSPSAVLLHLLLLLLLPHHTTTSTQGLLLGIISTCMQAGFHHTASAGIDLLNLWPAVAGVNPLQFRMEAGAARQVREGGAGGVWGGGRGPGCRSGSRWWQQLVAATEVTRQALQERGWRSWLRHVKAS